MKAGVIMKFVYVKIFSNWIDITDIGTINGCNVVEYINGNLDKMYSSNYVSVDYKDKNYCIHPSCIQIVTK